MDDNIKSILESMVEYCEKQAIYDKLGSHGDFYYKAKKALNKMTSNVMPVGFADFSIIQPVLGDFVRVILEDGTTSDIIWEGSNQVPVTNLVKIIGWKEA